MPHYSLCSYSIHRTVAAGKMDVFDYITWNKAAGFTQLDPWMKHIEQGYADNAYLDEVKAAAKRVNLPFGCIAVDGAHIYDASAEVRAENRQRAYRWIDICAYLGAPQVRIDAGGRQESAAEIYDMVVEGYRDIVAYAQKQGVEVVIENHWGPYQHPDNLYKLFDAVPGLGLLYDSYNWPVGTQRRAWHQYAKYATITHFKTFSFNERGEDPEQELPLVVGLLKKVGYQGTWGIESVPYDGNEVAAAEKTLAWLKRIVEN